MNLSEPTMRLQSSRGLGGRIFLTVFFLIFGTIGGALTWFATKEAAKVVRTYTWPGVPCQILSRRIGETNRQGRRTGDYYFEVRYRYTVQGRPFESDKYFPQEKPLSDYAGATRLIENYSEGSARQCFVNPAHPDEAILRRESLWILVMVPFTLIFVLIGVGGLVLAWRAKTIDDSAAVSRPISEKASPAKSAGCLALFFSFFLLFGATIFVTFFVLPATRIIQARNWISTPCTILASEVRTHRGNKGSTYSVHILYSYEFGGKDYKSNRYQFMRGSSSGYGGKAAIVRRYAPGTTTTCYVDPNDRNEAVLERGFTPDMWVGLIPLMFAIIGVGGIALAARSSRMRSAADWPKGQATLRQTPGDSPANPVVLKPAAPPWAKFIGTIVVALVWNGILSVFAFNAVPSWRRQAPPWGLTLFLIPFAAVGLFLIGAIVYQFLALFNPRPKLVLTPGAIPLGGSAELNWELSGRAHRVRRFQIHMQGREEATYRQGTRNAVDTAIFFASELINLDSLAQMQSGTLTLSLPAGGVMHSFSSDHNKIIWSIHVRGRIDWWPDVKEEFPITVLPLGSFRHA